MKCLQVISKLKHILLLFMIFITCNQRSLQGKKQLFYSWSMKPIHLWLRVMNIMNSNSIHLVHNLPMTCKHFTILYFRLVSPPTIATPNNNLLNNNNFLFKEQRVWLMTLHWCFYKSLCTLQTGNTEEDTYQPPLYLNFDLTCLDSAYMQTLNK